MIFQRFVSQRIEMEDGGSRFYRRRRFQMFLDLIDDVLKLQDVCNILDIGGEPGYWTGMKDLLGERNVRVTMVNLSSYDLDDPRFTSIAGDARNLSTLSDMSFDIVHSNSVIEHVGLWYDMVAMADEVRRLAPIYFVQTPYYWFPVEPHCSTALFHWLPESVRLSMLMWRPRGVWGKAPNVDIAMKKIHSAILLDRRMFGALFSDADIHSERVAGLTKSLIAIRKSTSTDTQIGVSSR